MVDQGAQPQSFLVTFRRIFVALLLAVITIMMHNTLKYVGSSPSARHTSDMDTDQRVELHTMHQVLQRETTGSGHVHTTQISDTLRLMSSVRLGGSSRDERRRESNTHLTTVTARTTDSQPFHKDNRSRLNELERSKLKTIRFLNGWKNWPQLVQGEAPDQFPSNFLKTCDYRCEIEKGTDNAVGAGISIFFANGLSSFRKPPTKSPDGLWVLLAGESQYLNAYRPSDWDGLFNYSSTFLHESHVSGQVWGFSQPFTKRTAATTRNFAKERREKHKEAATANALWFVSNCQPGGEFQPKSARVPYGLALSQFINISAYTRKNACLKPLASIIKKQSLNDQPRVDDFLFYLSFENNVCRDYITEKLWKVLAMDTFTIPVVLGGKDISDYTRIAPPNSFIHVRNFTSPELLAEHLNHIASNDDAFNYYHQWKNEYTMDQVIEKDKIEARLCHYCMLAHERPPGIWNTFSRDFTKKDCTNLLQPEQYCKYYNMSCTINTTV